MVPGLTSTNATLTAENSRLNDRMANLVQDLTEENKHLLDENQRLNETVQKVPSSCCIPAASCIIAIIHSRLHDTMLQVKRKFC